MKETFEKLTAACSKFLTEASNRIDGNKSAGVRSRVAITPIKELLKEWRKKSV